jgi:uncharacterized protein YqeY
LSKIVSEAETARNLAVSHADEAEATYLEKKILLKNSYESAYQQLQANQEKLAATLRGEISILQNKISDILAINSDLNSLVNSKSTEVKQL